MKAWILNLADALQVVARRSELKIVQIGQRGRSMVNKIRPQSVITLLPVFFFFFTEHFWIILLFPLSM